MKLLKKTKSIMLQRIRPSKNRLHINTELTKFAKKTAAGRDVLDIGSRKPSYITFLREQFSHCTVTTSDLFEGEGIDMILDASQMPFGNETRDTIVCTEVLEHVYDFMAIIHECHRVLKKGGRMFCSTPYMFPEHDKPDMPDYWRFTRQALENMYQNFEHIEIIPCGGREKAPVGYVVIATK